MSGHDPMAAVEAARPSGGRREPADPAAYMTAAEVQARREALGVHGDGAVPWIADELGVARRTWDRWERGQSRPPLTRGLGRDLEQLEEAADEQVAQLVAWVRDHPDEPIVTYRWDDEVPEGRWPAAWHRAVALRAARQAGARLIFSADR